MSTLRARSRRRHLVLVVVAVVGVAALGQLLLPPVAERVARGEIGDDRARVEIRALPAWKLVFGHVDALRVETPSLAVDADGLTAMLRRARKVDAGTITIGSLDVARVPVAIRRVVATLDHGRVAATAAISLADIAAQLPAGARLAPEHPHPDGQPRLRASFELLGTRTEVPIVVRARDGRLEAAGDAGIASAIRVSLFANDALSIDALRGRVDGDALTVRIRATLR